MIRRPNRQPTQQQDEFEALRSELAHEKAEHARTLAQLSARTAELRAVVMFRAKIDSHSDTDVLQLVKEFNAAVFQTSAQMANEMAGGLGMRASAELKEGVKEDMALRVGEATVQLLLQKRHDEDPTCIQIAFQACLMRHLSEIIEAWTLHRKCNVDDGPFGRVYHEMYTHEDQAVSGRWRALTRSYLRAVSDHNGIVKGQTRQLVVQLVYIALLAGVKGPSKQLFEIISSRFGSTIRSLMNQALDIRKVIGEDIISGDFKLLLPSDVPFDESMEDAYPTDAMSNAEIRQDAVVVRTAEVGLMRVVKSDSEDLNTTLLLKPKVILELSLNELNGNRSELWGAAEEPTESNGP